jgi:hypothetical protein
MNHPVATHEYLASDNRLSKRYPCLTARREEDCDNNAYEQSKYAHFCSPEMYLSWIEGGHMNCLLGDEHIFQLACASYLTSLLS